MKKIGKWILYFFLAIIVISIITGIMSDPEDVETNNKVNAAEANEPLKAKEQENGADQPENTDNWKYEEAADEMRGETSYFASNQSLNTVELDFPYNGGTNLNILLRKDAENGNDIMFAVNKGQLFCSYRDCYVNVKFDDGPVEKVAANEAAAGSSEVLFLANDISGFVKKLKAAKTVMIEVEFFNHGKEQFKFDVSGLEWGKF